MDINERARQTIRSLPKTVHGGQAWKLDNIEDYSHNLNPFGAPTFLDEIVASAVPSVWHYPDDASLGFRTAVANEFDVEPENVIAGAGSSDIIRMFPNTFLEPGDRVLMFTPSFAEYTQQCKICGVGIEYIRLREENDYRIDIEELSEKLTSDVKALYICNPNNPTSTSICHEQMLPILKHCHQNNIFVMIDETYVEFTENYEEVTAVPFTNDFTNLIVLRGISKFFAAPGLRLGYGITSAPSLRAAITRNQKAWSINSLAEVAARLMLTDCDYIKATRDLIFAERTRMVARLQQIPDVKVYLPTANFVLLRIMKEGKDAAGLFDLCIREKLMIRDCSTFTYLDDKYFRFCFMMPEQNEALLQCIEKYFAEK